MDYYKYREWLLSRIEGMVGTLHAEDPYGPGLSVLSIDALEKLYAALWGSSPFTDYKRQESGLD